MESPVMNIKGVPIDRSSSIQELSPLTKETLKSPGVNKTPFFFPYWLDIIYIPHTRLYENHGS